MWFNDITVPSLVSFFECSPDLAARIALEAEDYYHLGTKGEIPEGVDPDRRYGTPSHDEESLAVSFPEVEDTDELGRLLCDAWVEGLGEISRITVKVEHSETECPGCGSYDYDCTLNDDGTHDIRVCEECGDKFYGDVSFTVQGPFADIWCDAQGALDGGTWESAGVRDFMYDTGMDRPTLVEELQAAGYDLDLSEY